MSAARDREELEAILRAGSKTFFFAARALPRRMRDPTLALYSFCRKADDSVDEVISKDAGRRAVDALRARIERAYKGVPEGTIERAFARTVAEFAIPRRELDLLAEGMEWDVEARRYRTLADVRAYALRVAGTVGVMMTYIMGRTEPRILARARDLGIGMQLTNIARDVGADARIGRIYLPLDWLAAERVAPDELLRLDAVTPPVRTIIDRILRVADGHYTRADAGIAHLPADCRVAIRAARLIYADIGRVIGKRGFDSIRTRAVVSGRRKVWLLARALLALSWRELPLSAD